MLRGRGKDSNMISRMMQGDFKNIIYLLSDSVFFTVYKLCGALRNAPWDTSPHRTPEAVSYAYVKPPCLYSNMNLGDHIAVFPLLLSLMVKEAVVLILKCGDSPV